MRLYNRKMQKEYRRTLSNREANILSDLSYKGHIFFTPKDLQVYDSSPGSLIDGLSRKKWIKKIRTGVYMYPQKSGYSPKALSIKSMENNRFSIAFYRYFVTSGSAFQKA